MSGSIRLSPSHGVNPSLILCMACGESFGVALLGKLPPKREYVHGRWGAQEVLRDSDPEAPRQIVTGDLCDRCQKLLDGGDVLLIEAIPDPDPTPTGRAWLIKGEAYARIFNVPRHSSGRAYILPDAAKQILGEDYA